MVLKYNNKKGERRNTCIRRRENAQQIEKKGSKPSKTGLRRWAWLLFNVRSVGEEAGGIKLQGQWRGNGQFMEGASSESLNPLQNSQGLSSQGHSWLVWLSHSETKGEERAWIWRNRDREAPRGSLMFVCFVTWLHLFLFWRLSWSSNPTRGSYIQHKQVTGHTASRQQS